MLDGERPVVIAYGWDVAVGIVGLWCDLVFFARFFGKRGGSVLVTDGIFRGHQVFAIRTKDLVQRRLVKAFRRVN
jgi:hypothetical protein